MDAAFMESFFQAAMQQEPIDYDKEFDVDGEKEYAFNEEELKPDPLCASVKIKQEILDEPEDNSMSSIFVESAEKQHFTDHTYASVCLDIPIKEEYIEQETEYSGEENIWNIEDANLNILESTLKNEESMTLTSLIDDKVMEEIISDYDITDGLLEFHDSIDRTIFKQGELITDETVVNKQIEEIEFKCKHCFYKFKSPDELEIHMQKHFIKNVFKCKTCKEEFITAVELIKHEFTHVSSNVYLCRYCRRVYFTIVRYKLHLKCHEKDRSSQCYGCKKIFHNKNSRIYHEKKCKLRKNYNLKKKGDLRRNLFSKNVPLKYVSANMDKRTKEHLYPCDRCDRKFIYKVDRDLHLKEECFYKCTFCGKLLEDSTIFENHLKMVHPDKVLHICKLCCKTFDYECDMMQHMKNHKESTTQVPQLVCNVCRKLGEKSCNCIENKQHNILESRCKYCTKIFQTKLLLEQHLQTEHSAEQLFPCDYCDEKFSTEWNKVKHMIKHRYEFKKKTTKMGALLENFKRKRNLKKIAPISPSILSENSDSFENIKIKQESNPDNIENSNQQYVLENQEIKLENVIPDRNIDDGNVRSDTSMQKYNNRSTLHSYVPEFAPKKKLRIVLNRCNISELQCQICKKMFVNVNAKKNHMKVHKQNIKCNICCETFKTRTELETHLKFHQESNEFECDFCNETFNCLKDQQNHLLKHSAYQHGNFKCDKCEKSFISQSTYRRHMFVHKA